MANGGRTRPLGVKPAWTSPLLISPTIRHSFPALLNGSMPQFGYLNLD
jgi:hypothetical protein